jgi:hypothetical protein
MTDSTVAQAPVAATTDATQPTSTQSPLDILDQILNEAQAKSADSAAEKSKEEERKMQEELERQKQEDKEKLEQQIIELESIKQSPQYQARIEQDQEIKDESEKKKEELQGNQIFQLKRTTM